MTQTPKISDEAIAAAAAWWVKVLENPKFDALGGERDRSMEFAQILMSVGAAKNRPDPDALALFRHTLAAGIREYVGTQRERCYIGVDYGPDSILSEAARHAGLPDTGFTFPIKTSMWLAPDSVTVRYGYGAEIRTVWESKASEAAA